jgi:hypothetical protein
MNPLPLNPLIRQSLPSRLQPSLRPSLRPSSNPRSRRPILLHRSPNRSIFLIYLLLCVLRKGTGWKYAVIFVEGEIKKTFNCKLCTLLTFGSNFIDKKGYIRGARGMLAHTSKSHKLDTLGGKKVDSTSILEFCTHRELSHADVLALMAGDMKVETVICREIGANGQVSTTPKTTKAPPPAPAVVSHTEDDDRPYDWLQKYPTIVLRRDGQWVELRCDLCGVRRLNCCLGLT